MAGAAPAARRASEPSGRTTHTSVRVAPGGATVQASHVPEGDQVVAITRWPDKGTATGRPPCRDRIHTSGMPLRSEMNATRSPPGDRVGHQLAYRSSGTCG